MTSPKTPKIPTASLAPQLSLVSKTAARAHLARCAVFGAVACAVTLAVWPGVSFAKRMPPAPQVAPLSSVTGVLVVRSYHTVPETMKRFEALVRAAGFTVFTQIDHSANAQSIDDPIPPAQLLVFGDIRSITDLIQVHPTAALDLPMRALIWQDDTGAVWLGYMDPIYLADRHNFPSDEAIIQQMASTLRDIAQRAAGFGAVAPTP